MTVDQWKKSMLKPQLEMGIVKLHWYFFFIKISCSYSITLRGDVKIFRGRVNVLKGVQN
jgi:hypothetical protein